MPKPRTPTQIIARSPARTERVWFKKPTKPLVQASQPKDEAKFSVKMRYKGRKPKIEVHTHPTKKGRIEPWNILPSEQDLTLFLNTIRKHNRRVEIIAIRDGKKVAGYTIVRMLAGKKGIKKARRKMEKYDELHERLIDKPYSKKRFMAMVEWLRRNGFQIRLVANRNRGYELRHHPEGVAFSRRKEDKRIKV